MNQPSGRRVTEYKTGNYSVHNLGDAFRRSHVSLGRNIAEADANRLAALSTSARSGIVIAGHGSRDQGETRRQAYLDPGRFGALMERIEAALVALADYSVTVGFDRVHLLEEGEDVITRVPLAMERALPSAGAGTSTGPRGLSPASW